MPDARFFHIANPLTVREILTLVEGVLLEDYRGKALTPQTYKDIDAKIISGVDDFAKENIDNACVYIAHQKFLIGNNDDHPFGLCLIQKSLIDKNLLDSKHLFILSSRGPIITVDDAQVAFIQVANKLYREKHIEMDTKLISEGESKHPSAIIHPTAIIAKDAMIGEGCRIGAFAFIGPGVLMGEHCTIESHVSVTHALVGDRVHICTGARIGQAGFGFVVTQSGPLRMPQLGGVIIGDGVEIGANSTVDRATLGNTIIGAGTCLDNQVQIAHNVEVGENCLFAAHVGISGSCKIGDNVMLGGKVGIADHLRIGNGVRMAGNSSTMRDIPDNQVWAGTPAQPFTQYMREVATVRKLASNKKKDKK